jgi:MFS family permease
MLSLYLVVDDLIGLYALSAGFGLAFGGIIPAYALAIRDLFPGSEAGWRVGCVFSCGTAGMALGAWLGGYVFDMTASYQMAFLVGVIFNMMNLVLIGLLVLRQSRYRFGMAVA